MSQIQCDSKIAIMPRTIWFLQISVAKPGYKFPSAATVKFHFATKKKALRQLEKCKKDFVVDHASDDDATFESVSDSDHFYTNMVWNLLAII